MTPADALAIVATIGKRLRDPAELEAFRMAYAALKTPLEAEIEAVRKLRPQASVSLQCVESDPELGPWAASIEWREYTKIGAIERIASHEVAELGKTPQEALVKLREALGRIPAPKTPEDAAYEAAERAAIQGEPRGKQ